MKFCRKILVKALLLVLIIALLGWIVMRLWNWIVPTLIVDAHAIDYPRAIGLLVLSRILFGGFRGHGGCNKARQWRHWQQMTQQERERLRNDSTSAPRRSEGEGT
jgi:ABC-type multidrug transport system fused ATPase/permease subunit